MSEPAKPAAVQQITVAVDTSLRALDALEIAAALAARRQASLEALFVEDINLLNLARLPFARELDSASGAYRRLDEPQIASDLRNHLQRVRKALEQAAKQRRLRTAIRVKRGHYFAEALAMPGVDVLFLTATARVSYKRKSAAPHTRSRAPFWVIYDASPGASRALRLAAELSETNATPLGVAVLAEGETERLRLTREVAAIIERDAIPAGPSLVASDERGLRQALARAGCSLLLVPRERPALATDPSGGLLGVLDCPLVVVA